MKKFQLCFDNGGSLTMNLNDGEYVHCYDDMIQAANDFKEYMRGTDLSDWENHQPECHETEERIENDYFYDLDSLFAVDSENCGYSLWRFINNVMGEI